MLSQEYFDIYNRLGENEAELRLKLFPDKYLIIFSSAINQLIRINESALYIKNKEIIRESIYCITDILKDLTRQSKNDLFVKQILDILYELTDYSIKNKDETLYYFSTFWYINIVFNEYNENKFDISYLSDFNKYFFRSIIYAISENQFSLFNIVVKNLYEGFFDRSMLDKKIYDYYLLINKLDRNSYNNLNEEYRIFEKIRDFENSQNEIYSEDDINKSLEKLNDCLNKLSEIKNILLPYLNEEQKTLSQEIESEVKEYLYFKFKFDSLIEIVFGICAFCIFKQKPEYIKYLWNYKQPKDSEATWIGHDIVPNSINNLVNLYFKRGIYNIYNRRYDFYEEHHGSEIYYKKYFLLLLGRIIQSSIKSNKDPYELIKDYKIPDMNIYRLNDLLNSIGGLIDISVKLKEENEFLNLLDFDIELADRIFDEYMKNFLNALKIKTQERISYLQMTTPISQNKVNEFKNNFIEGFYKTVIIREFFKHFNLYNDKTDKITKNKLETLGLSKIFDKGAFFDEWHITYLPDLGSYFGGQFSLYENSYLFKKIASFCKKKINENRFDYAIERLNNLSNVVIFATFSAINKFFENSKNFITKYHRYEERIDINGFDGWYLFKDLYIPIFSIGNIKDINQILILDISKLGTLIQYSPLENEDNVNLIKDIFNINIISLSENKELIEEILTKQPDLFKDIEKREDKIKRLKESVIIEIYEKFEFKKHEQFSGFKIILKD